MVFSIFMIALLDSNNRNLIVQNISCKITWRSRNKTNLLSNKTSCSAVSTEEISGCLVEHESNHIQFKFVATFWTPCTLKAFCRLCCSLSEAPLSIAALFPLHQPHIALSAATSRNRASSLILQPSLFFTSNCLVARFNSDNFFCLFSFSASFLKLLYSLFFFKRCRQNAAAL